MIEIRHLLRAKLENLERLARFLKVDIPQLRDKYAKQLVLSQRILTAINNSKTEKE